MNSLEIKDKRAQLKTRGLEIVERAKNEIRDLTDEELAEVENIKKEIADLDNQLKELMSRLENLKFETDDEQDKNEPEPSEDEQRKQTKNHKFMNQKFSLIKTIRSIVNNTPLDEVSLAVISEGEKEARAAGINAQGQIKLPSAENRAAISVSAEGDDLVATDVFDVLEPLRAKSVLKDAGAKFYSGLVGNVQVPVMGKSNVAWAGETAAAADGASSYTHKTLSPKRLTAYVDISKQLLAQDSAGVESTLRADIVNAINSKFEATIFGAAAGDTTQPAGIFYGATNHDISDFIDVTEFESTLENADVYGEKVYVMSPAAKADLRAMVKGNGCGLVYENGEVDGTAAYTTSNVPANRLVYGDFSNLAVGMWSATDITVDPYSQAANGCVRLVINAYVDAQVLRPEAFAAGTTVDGE